MPEALNLSITDLALAGGIIWLAVAVQSTVGFGSALVAVPALLWLGVPLPTVIALVATVSMIQSCMGAHNLRGSVPWRLTFVAVVVMLAGLGAGLLMLRVVADLRPEYVRRGVGIMLCVLVGLQCVVRPQPVARLHWLWGAVAFLSSGFLGGVCGLSGPPLVIWSMAHDWPAAKTRGFLFASFAATNPVSILLLSFMFGPQVLWGVMAGLACLPVVALGGAVGLRVGQRIEKERLRKLAYGLLLAIGVGATVR